MLVQIHRPAVKVIRRALRLAKEQSRTRQRPGRLYEIRASWPDIREAWNPSHSSPRREGSHRSITTDDRKQRTRRYHPWPADLILRST
jgi:hypothetical protein